MDFIKEFKTAIDTAHPDGIDWDLVGILTKKQEVYTLSHDSKILSGIFEILCEPIISEIARKYQLQLIKGVQNQYPEFTLCKTPNAKNKIAIDVKTTYRRYNKSNNLSPFKFTLGSYKSYLRNAEKGIRFPYNEYTKHWIVGFVYSRNDKCINTEIKKVIDASSLEVPYTNIEYFVQEKWKIASKTTGSGDTTNIGSISSSDINDFRLGKGAFKTINEFEEYWKIYVPSQKN